MKFEFLKLENLKLEFLSFEGLIKAVNTNVRKFKVWIIEVRLRRLEVEPHTPTNELTPNPIILG